jgi:hypothetical protein
VASQDLFEVDNGTKLGSKIEGHVLVLC